MPSRIIRETIRTSPTLNQITAEAHRLWSHLLTVADDEGRFLSDAGIVLANCFPLKIGIMRRGAVEKSLLELDRAGLITLYYSETKDRRYGQFVTWKVYNPRCRYTSKWPPPPVIPTNGKHVESAPTAKCGALNFAESALTRESSLNLNLSLNPNLTLNLKEKKIAQSKKSAVSSNGHHRHLTDEQWLEELKKKPCYSHIDFNHEDGKMDVWFSEHHGRKKTRKFMINWFNKIDRPVKLTRERRLATKPKSFMRMQEAEAMMRAERRDA